jgi:hypothetical protein
MAPVTERPTRTPPTQQRTVEPASVNGGRRGTALRIVGALALLVVGAVHLEQYIVVHFDVVPVIGPLFLLNFIGATAIAIGLLLPLRALHGLFALGGVAVGLTSIVFLEISEHRPLFGFEDYGYRPAIVIALVAEALTVILLGASLAVRRSP